jgi:S-adenosylhomocysteine hydrolase
LLQAKKIGGQLTKMTPEQSKYLSMPEQRPLKAESYRY